MTWTVKAIKPDSLKSWWPVVTTMLKPAVAQSGGRVTMATLYRGLAEGRYLLWVALDQDEAAGAAFVTRVSQYPARKMLTVECAGGTNMTDWLEGSQATFRSFARDHGLSGVEMFGRTGWVKALGRFGWHQTGVLCEVAT